MNKFPCISCGLCCHNPSPAINTFKQWVDDFPEEWLGEGGKCTKLLNSGLCEVYEDRPTICNIDKMYGLFPNMSKSDFYQLNKDSCISLLEKGGKTKEEIELMYKEL